MQYKYNQKYNTHIQYKYNYNYPAQISLSVAAILCKVCNFSTQNGPGAHLASYSLGAAVFPLGQSGHSVKLTAHLQPVPRLRISGAKLLQTLCVPGVGRDVFEICSLLGHYAASRGNPLPTFRNNVSVPSSGVKKSRNS
jgi:hypothetical protein